MRTRLVVCVLLLWIAGSLQSGAQAPRPPSSITVTPTKIEFSAQPVGTSSPPAAATVANTGNAPVTIRDISASGIDFKQTNDCPATLGAGASCKIQVTFTPAITGPRLGTIIVSTSDTGAGAVIYLVVDGTGQ